MAHNRYFIVNATDPNLDEIIGICIGCSQSQRYNIAGTQLVVKLPEGDHENHPPLQQYMEYDHEQILQALNNIEWTQPI